MTTYSTVADFTAKFPDAQEAIQCLFIAPNGEIRQFIIPIEDWSLEFKYLMISYVFVNEWQLMVQTIRNFR